MLGHVEMDDSAPIVGQDDKYEQNLESRGWHDEEIDPDQFTSVLLEKGFCGSGRVVSQVAACTVQRWILRHQCQAF